MAETQIATRATLERVATNRVLRNTYMLLSMTMLFSAVMTGVSMALNTPYFMSLTLLLASLGMIFVINRFRNSSWGILLVFAFTGMLGFSLGPIINLYVMQTGGTEIVMSATGLTGLIFFGLSGYVLVTKKDFSFMGGFLMTGLLLALGVMVLLLAGSFFGFYMPGVHLALSAVIVLLMSGFILYETSRIVNGGETNYVMATVSLYLSIYNIFTSLLHLLGAAED